MREMHHTSVSGNRVHSSQFAAVTRQDSAVVAQGAAKQDAVSQSFASLLQSQQSGAVVADSALKGLAIDYDVTNLSGHERIALAQSLRDNNLISSGAQLALTAPLSINENMQERTNLLASAEGALEFARSSGASKDQLQILTEQLDILQQLYDLRSLRS